jgi:hypothetical protein
MKKRVNTKIKEITSTSWITTNRNESFEKKSIRKVNTDITSDVIIQRLIFAFIFEPVKLKYILCNDF